MKRTSVCAVVLSVLLPAAVFAAEGIRPGLWEITSTMDVPGMPMKMPPTTVKHCYRLDDVKDQKKVISRDKDCAVTDLKSSGNKVAWKMKCTGKNPGTFSGETVFSGDSYESTMKMEPEGGKGSSMNMKVTGKRVGNCP
ncbi:MAG: DUF3617 domain-containing protein [Nitrospirae bacterium]|nr:DUF3617 domain-containing protein [Nitrospirota bacterium]NTW67143.1 DUF3617 domain-containing protein [Nitrospirota bacterium]